MTGSRLTTSGPAGAPGPGDASAAVEGGCGHEEGVDRLLDRRLGKE